jgi:hypothetical protein
MVPRFERCTPMTAALLACALGLVGSAPATVVAAAALRSPTVRMPWILFMDIPLL